MNISTPQRYVRPDSKGRITLGHLADGISSFIITEDKQHHRIILEPMVEIPAHEKWLLKNKSAQKQLQKGLDDSAKGKVKERGSFSQYQDEDID